MSARSIIVLCLLLAHLVACQAEEKSAQAPQDTRERQYGICLEHTFLNPPYSRTEISMHKFRKGSRVILESDLEERKEEIFADSLIRYVVHMGAKHMVVAPDPDVYQLDDTMDQKITISFSADTTFYDALVRLVWERNWEDTSCTWLSFRGSYEHYHEEFPECYWEQLGRDLHFEQASFREVFLALLTAPTKCQMRYTASSWEDRDGDGVRGFSITLSANDVVKPEKYRRLDPDKMKEGIRRYQADFPRRPPQEWLDARKDKCKPAEESE